MIRMIFDGDQHWRAYANPTATCRAQAKAFEEDLVLFDTVTGKGDIHPQAKEEIAYAYQALIHRHTRLCPQMQFQENHRRPQRGQWTPPLSPPLPSTRSARKTSSASPCPALTPLAGSQTDAKCLAHNLGVELLTIPVSSVFDSYIQSLKPVFGNSSHGRHRGKHSGAHPRQLF